MGGNRQRKSSSSGFFSIFNIFCTKKPKAGYLYDLSDSGRKIWPSDYDKDSWGVAEPNIDMKAEAFIRKYKQRVSESACCQLDPSSRNG